MKKFDTTNIVTTLRSNRTISALFLALVMSLVLLFANFVYLNVQSSYDTEYIGHSGELRVLSQQISKSATEAATGTREAFPLLLQARNDYEERWRYLTDGRDETGLPPTPGSLHEPLEAAGADWDRVRANADAILSSEETVLSLHDLAAQLSDTVPQLQVEYEDVVDVLIDSGASATQVSLAQRQSLLAERILGSVNRVLAGDADAVMAADSFGRDATLFGRVLDGMINGNEVLGIARVTDADAVSRLEEIADLFSYVSESVEQILLTSPELYQVRTAANSIFTDSQQLLNNVSDLSQAFEKRSAGRWINTLLGYVLAAVALGSILLIGLQLTRETRIRLAETAATNERNQAAILRLLDEIADLADGDLTAE